MIRVQSPTRIDLAGGTLDCWPLSAFLLRPQTINLAIDIWTTAELDPRSDEKVIIESLDLGETWEFSQLEGLLSAKDERLRLFQAIAHYWRPSQGFLLRTRSESPVGGGLGGSSSLVVSMNRVFEKWLNQQLRVQDFVELCHNQEAYVLQTPTGTQDYYPAYFGGVNYISYDWDGRHVVVEPPDDVFFQNMAIVYTGRAHHSGINNWDVIRSVVDKNTAVMQQLRELQTIAQAATHAIRGRSWSDLVELWRREFEARKLLSPAFCSPEILELHDLAMSKGAGALKICGAGGGGCVMIWADPLTLEDVKDSCQTKNFRVLAAQPVQPLTQIGGTELSSE